MANSPVMTRKDMREPDRFQVVAGQAATWLAGRKKQAAIAGGAVVALVLVIGIVSAVQNSRAAAAGVAMTALLESVGAPVVAKPAEGTPYKTFPAEEAKQRAVLAEAEKLIADYGTSQRGILAVLVKGDAHYALREWDAAAAEYERFLKSAPADDSLRFGALMGLALVAEAKKDLAGAAAGYERLAKEAPRYADRADLERARVLAEAGKADEARQILGKFGETHKESSLASAAAQRLAQLGAK
jgi:predicted negative regulator of RcsB-dependent stress response